MTTPATRPKDGYIRITAPGGGGPITAAPAESRNAAELGWPGYMLEHVPHIFARSNTVEYWRPTMSLRQRVSEGTSTKPPILEQKWTSSNGREEWRPIEVVVASEVGR